MPASHSPAAPSAICPGMNHWLMPTKLSLVARPWRAMVQLPQSTLSTPESSAPDSSAPGSAWA